MYKLSKIFATLFFLFIFSGAAFAGPFGLEISSIYFNAEEKADFLGEGTSMNSDGKTDASFSLAVSGAQAIKDISLKNTTTGRTWSTSQSSSAGLLIVKDSSGNVLNTSGGMPVTPVLLGADFKLYINDAETAIPRDSDFTVTVTLIDNNQITGKTSVKGQGKPVPLTPVSEAEGISLFEINGISEHDFAGKGEKVAADGKNDSSFTLFLDFRDTTVRAMKITASSPSKKAEWDTIAGNNIPIVTVIDSKDNILNKTDGTVAFSVKGSQRYIILVQDNDKVTDDPAAKVKIIISLSDGKIFEKEAVRGKTAIIKESLSAEYKGTGKYDFTGLNEKIEPNLNADRQIDAVINVSGIVAGVRVKSSSSGKIWDTINGNGNPLLVITDNNGAIQNRKDGTVSLSVKGEKTFSLWFEEEDDQKTGPYQVTIVMSNGQVFEASTEKITAALPAVTKADRSVAFTAAKPAVINTDIVGKNKKLAANGSKDMALNVKITGKGIIKAISITDSSGKGWDTLAENNGRWLLAVREGSKILNTKKGTVRITVNGTKTFQLLMQDNGKLAKKNGKIKLSVTWGDGQVTESSLKW